MPCWPASPTSPRYFARMRPLNQAGPPLLGGRIPVIEPLDGEALDRELERGALLCRRAKHRGPRGAARAGFAVVPGRLVVRDLARLGGRPRPAGRPARRRPRRARRDRAPGAADRVRIRSSATSTAGCAAGGGRPRGPGRVAARRRPARRASWRAAARRRRSSSTSGRPRNTRPATSRARSTSAPASCRRSSTSCRATGRSSRSARAATAPASPPRCCVPRASSTSASVAVGVPTWEARGHPLDYGPADGGAWSDGAAVAAEPHAH